MSNTLLPTSYLLPTTTTATAPVAGNASGQVKSRRIV